MKVAAKKQTLKNVTDYITDVICKRADSGYNYGVILIPEGLIDFIPEVYTTILRSICSLSLCCCFFFSERFFFFLFNIVVMYLQVQQLISELNEILAHDVVDEAGAWKKKLGAQSLQLFDFLPQAIQAQLLLERDPHGNVQVMFR